MGNETVQSQKNNRKSFSVDFGHQLPSKIKPNLNSSKLAPINQRNGKHAETEIRQNARSNKFKQFSNDHQQQDDDQQQQEDRQNERIQRQKDEERRREHNNVLKKLNTKNDQLRKQLIRISSELTEKLKKKKYEVKKAEILDNNPKKESLKKQLDNAYKQIDMYKRVLSDLKVGEQSAAKLLQVQDKIATVDKQIERAQQQIQAIKNVTVNQSAGIRKQKGWQALDELKSEVEALKLSLKQRIKQERAKQKKYIQQQYYMKLLQEKLKQLQKEQEKERKRNSQQYIQEPTEYQIKVLEKEIQDLKQKRQQYNKKINAYLIGNKLLRQNKKQLKEQLEEKKKMIQSLKYKRDAFVKQIKDNLHFFVTRTDQKQQQMSQFESEQQQEYDPIQQEEDERGTFDVEHLKDHKLKNISKQDVRRQQEKREVFRQETQKAEPKQWRKQVTRIISKGKQMPNQKTFETGIKATPLLEMKIVQMNIWMNKKKQILSIQPQYMIDGRKFEANKSSKNIEDQYKVSYELEENDFLKSVLGIFGKSGFLQYLVLQSERGKISKIGRQQSEGDNFAIGVSRQQTPVKITGASSQDGGFWRINRLQFEVLIEI